MDLSLLFLHRQWLAGRSSAEDRPTAVRRLQSALGSLPSVALSSAGANGLLCREFKSLHGECFRFPFPWGSIDGERETAGDWKPGLS